MLAFIKTLQCPVTDKWDVLALSHSFSVNTQRGVLPAFRSNKTHSQFLRLISFSTKLIKIFSKIHPKWQGDNMYIYFKKQTAISK